MKFFVTILLALASIGASAQNQAAYTVPSMLTFGDSITAGYPYGFSPYPTLLQNNFGGVPLVNVAIPAEMACGNTATNFHAGSIGYDACEDYSTSSSMTGATAVINGPSVAQIQAISFQ